MAIFLMHPATYQNPVQRQLRLWLLGVALLGAVGSGNAQWMGYTARSQALGNTGLILAEGSGLLVNPASLPAHQQALVLASATQHYLIPELGTFDGAVVLPARHAGWGIMIAYSGYELFNQKKAALSYGRLLSEKIAVGVQMDFFQTAVQEYGTSNTFTGEVGMNVQLPGAFHLAARIFNPYPISWGYEGQKIPTVFQMGTGYQPATSVLLMAEVEKDIDQPMRVRLGVEYLPAAALALRAGMLTQPEVFCAGIGLNLGRLTMDFSTQYHQTLGISPAATLLYGFPQKKKAGA